MLSEILIRNEAQCKWKEYIQDKCALSRKVTIHGPCRRERMV